MDKNEIKFIVAETIAELKRQGMIKDNYKAVKGKIEPELYEYFKKGNQTIKKALIELSDDQYIDLIYLLYRDCFTIEHIADVLKKDASTIKRNKKRLLISIYNITFGIENLI